MKPDIPVSPSIMIIAGEASGDMHGAGLIKALQQLKPAARFFGMGGKELTKAGVEIVCDVEKTAVMGVTEIFSALGGIFSTLNRIKTELRQRKPDLVILVDFAGFNLRIARLAHKLNIPVFYYIPPKVWVWRKNRIKLLAKYVSRTGVILPFEEIYLKKRGVQANYVGNPVLEEVVVKMDREAFCKKYGIDSGKALVGILPGSRKKEVAYLLPVFLEAARRMQKKYSRELVFLIPLASTLSLADLENCGLREFSGDLEIHLLAEDRYDLMAACDAAMAASGTVTLELAVLDIPMVVAYIFAPLSYAIGKLFIDIPYFSLVNIIAGKSVVTELLQDQVHPGSVEIELARVVFDENVRKYMMDDYHLIRKLLGKECASENAARIALDTMTNR
ncbi:MAG: lipid-A-disaccharide synthase [Desulfopila sp.]|jgi:lipid-A-disaccharide synthase|nr:lipid-A-disaccharide synthase [Desulfopila sp.]